MKEALRTEKKNPVPDFFSGAGFFCVAMNLEPIGELNARVVAEAEILGSVERVALCVLRAPMYMSPRA